MRVGVRVGADYWLYTEPLSCDSLRARYLLLTTKLLRTEPLSCDSLRVRYLLPTTYY